MLALKVISGWTQDSYSWLSASGEMYPSECSGEFRIQDAERVKTCLELKEWKSGWTEKRKKSPCTNQAERTDTDKASCEVNSKHCFCQGHAAVINYLSGPFFGWLLTSDTPHHLLFPFATRDTQLLSHLHLMTTPSSCSILSFPNWTSKQQPIQNWSLLPLGHCQTPSIRAQLTKDPSLLHA